MDVDAVFNRYNDLQRYVGWNDEHAARIRAAAPILQPHLAALIEDFYAEVDRHPAARRVITGGPEQIARLSRSLAQWLDELLAGEYDTAYVLRRWSVGRRHVEIGLDQVYTNMALSRLRSGLQQALVKSGPAADLDVPAALESLNKLLDLDLAMIEDAYQTEYALRQQRAERLVVIGQVAGGVAHEIRNPLNVIKTSTYFLLNARNASPEKRAEHLTRIEKRVDIADGIITALANFARLPVPQRVSVSVEQLCRNVVESVRLPANIELEFVLPPDLPPALADAAQIRIVLANLVRNARDAMPDGGRLAIAGGASDGQVEISVTDTGHGITPDNLQRITEPFFTTKARGLGLGLAISRAILEKNAGAFAVTSEPGKGSTFKVRLERAGDAANGGAI